MAEAGGRGGDRREAPASPTPAAPAAAGSLSSPPPPQWVQDEENATPLWSALSQTQQRAIQKRLLRMLDGEGYKKYQALSSEKKFTILKKLNVLISNDRSIPQNWATQHVEAEHLKGVIQKQERASPPVNTSLGKRIWQCTGGVCKWVVHTALESLSEAAEARQDMRVHGDLPLMHE